ncbi:hypothetical protein MLD38_006242 [Melastoma candidum]|uniref:Uncharacterized protein n=1 Tax=Melastoma candidum TaxID=119954 RepID=A0ACB9RLZ1_9MYRT|nr:hypothetical protein MLD38_006242 [Melastoma candidum]
MIISSWHTIRIACLMREGNWGLQCLCWPISAESAPFEKRPILAYFRGAIYRKEEGFIRQELFYLLKDAKDVHFAFGSIQGHGVSHAGQRMASSKFCLNIAGDTPSSNRLFDAIVNYCVPVNISDEIELLFEDVLDYSEFCIFIHSTDAVKKNFLLSRLRGISKDEWTDKWKKLKVVAPHFEYQYPLKPGDRHDLAGGHPKDIIREDGKASEKHVPQVEDFHEELLSSTRLR